MFIKISEVPISGTMVFGKNQQNRMLSVSHVNKLKKQAMKYHDVFLPIRVNKDTMNIIDGQHRLKALQELFNDGLIEDINVRIQWESMTEDEEMDAIVECNTHSKNWSVDDYIRSYISANNPYYKKLVDFCDSHILCVEEGKNGVHKCNYRYAAAMIMGKNCSTILKNGTLEFSDEQIDEADLVHDEMLEIISRFGLPANGNWIESLATSWWMYRSLYPVKLFMSHLSKNMNKLRKKPTQSQRDWNLIFDVVISSINREQQKKMNAA